MCRFSNQQAILVCFHETRKQLFATHGRSKKISESVQTHNLYTNETLRTNA